MKNLKIKFGLFSLLAILAASVFLTSCEQEVIQSVSDQEILIEKMLNDSDVINFIEASSAFEKEMIQRISMNVEEYERYLQEENHAAIHELLNLSEIAPLMEDMFAKKNIVLDKYPVFPDVFEEVLLKYNKDNSIVTERCTNPAAFYVCTFSCWTQSCVNNCWWWYCADFFS